MVRILATGGLLAMGLGGFLLWARFGTEDPVEHHSSMPHTWNRPEG
ncbi:hypothetical protein [Streptomyces sp. NBC_01233]|nr:hypothetical protein OG332_36530 [Streptomyces sp. NBC_01233]